MTKPMKNKNPLLKLQTRTLANEKGFTLTELLIVIALIGGLMALIGPNILRKFGKGKRDTTVIQIRQLMTTLEDFKRDCGYYPTSDQGLSALRTKPTAGRECKNYDPMGYLGNTKKLPVDGWNNDFVYESDGTKYLITSLGEDMVAGGTDLGTDVTSDNLDDFR